MRWATGRRTGSGSRCGLDDTKNVKTAAVSFPLCARYVLVLPLGDWAFSMCAVVRHAASGDSRVRYRGVPVCLWLALALVLPWAAGPSLAVEPDAAATAAAGADTREQRVSKRIVSGDTLPRLLTDLGVSPTIKNRWLRAVAKQFGVANVLRAGDTIRFYFIAPWNSWGPGEMTALRIERAGAKPLTWQLRHDQVVYHRERGLRPMTPAAERVEPSAQAAQRVAKPSPKPVAEDSDQAQDGDQARAQGRRQAQDRAQASRRGGGEGYGGSLLRRRPGDPCPPEGGNPRTRAARQGSFQQNGAALDSGCRQTVFAEAVVSGPEDRPLFRGGVFPRPRPANPAGLADRIEGRRPADVAMERWSDHIPRQKSSGGGERSPDRACTCNGKDPGCRWPANAHVTAYAHVIAYAHAIPLHGPSSHWRRWCGRCAGATPWDVSCGLWASPGRKARRGSTPSTDSIPSPASDRANASISISKRPRRDTAGTTSRPSSSR